MPQHNRSPKRRAPRPARMNQHTPPARCRLCVWLEDCSKLRRPMLRDCDVFIHSGLGYLPRNAEGDMQQVPEHDVEQI
jgi:hypothetical protein